MQNISWPQNSFQASIEPNRKIDFTKLMNTLASAFGGFSGIPDETVGFAIASQMNANSVAPPSYNEIASWLEDRWDHLRSNEIVEIVNTIIDSANNKLKTFAGYPS